MPCVDADFASAMPTGAEGLSGQYRCYCQLLPASRTQSPAYSWFVRIGPDTRRVTTVPAWLAVLGLVVPAGTGLIGYVLAGRNEQARDDRAAKREAVARRASVRERLQEQSHAFQRETLLELQDALQR
jgi:hypothetical protein